MKLFQPSTAPCQPELRLALNAHLGKPFINAMGVRAFQNAIAAAKKERRLSKAQR